MSPTVSQVYSYDYRNPGQIATKNVLVVGSGSSGVQICEDLAKSQRFEKISLAVSNKMVLPLRVLGIHLFSIVRFCHMLDIRSNSWLGQKLLRDQSKGKGDPMIPPSPAKLANEYGVELVGKVTSVEKDTIFCSDGATLPTDDLTVLWCTGFHASYDYIQLANGEKFWMRKDSPYTNAGSSAARQVFTS